MFERRELTLDRVLWALHTACHARNEEDMNSDLGRWESQARHIDRHWVQSYSPRSQPTQVRRNARTNTSPVLTRSALERQPIGERRGSVGSQALLPVRQRRRHSNTQVATLKDLTRSCRRWPPRGFTTDSSLSPEEAEDLVGAGASTFKGYCDQLPNTQRRGHHRFYAVLEHEHHGRTDRATFRNDAFAEMSLAVTGSKDSPFPWISLEQPSMASCFGKGPGTTTLNFWVGKSGSLEQVLHYGADARPKKIKMLAILDRLRQLEAGLEEDDPDAMCKHLYGTLIDDADRDKRPRHGMELQISDLITILGNTDWVDFSLPQNQVVAKFFDCVDGAKRQHFFHQLLLSVELHLRIHSAAHLDKAKRKLLMQLPPKIAWDLALAQRWLENMSISRSSGSSGQSTFSFDLRSKKRQKETLLAFAATLKWPNMAEVGYILEEKDRREQAVEDRSADAMSWFTGVVLPGPSLPWLVMNSLIDCDKDTAGALKYLTHMHPASGFQYRANTYWSHECIVGKVLGAARGVSQVAGWIGPCIYTPDLKRTECVRIRQPVPPRAHGLARTDVETMALRTSPLGPADSEYPVADYELVVPDVENAADEIRVQKLSFQPVKDQAAAAASRSSGGGALTFEAAIVFAFGGDTYPLRLTYDVDFISAYPCQQGPHVLFYDYSYRIVKVDDGLVDIQDWGLPLRDQTLGPLPVPPSPSSPSANDCPSTSTALTRTTTKPTPSSSSAAASAKKPAHMNVAEVLVIEALGVSDNEVFARAWCARWGVSAVLANVKHTCVACAVREAFAACVNVVVLTEGGRPGEKDDDVVGVGGEGGGGG